MAATILCVDDDRHLCRILEKAFQGEGFRVVSAHDGEQGLAAFEAGAPDLVLLDVLLPRRDGFEVLERIRATNAAGARMPALLLSSCRITPEYQERADALGAAALLAKPVPLADLLRHVKQELKPVVRRKATARRRRSSGKGRSAGAGRRTSAAAKPLSGSFDELAFPHLLHQLHGLRATGVLMLGSGKKRKALQMRDGYPVAVKSNLVGECLGNMLLRRGSLIRAELDESLRRLKKGQGLQGEILVAMELLNEEEVPAVLREQAEEKLFEIFTWKRGRFKFEIGGRLKRANALALDQAPANLILQGVRNRLPLERVDHYLHERSAGFPAPNESPFYRFQEIDLDPEERALLERLDGTLRLRDVLDEGERLRRTLYGLLATEMLELRARAGRASAPAPQTRAQTVETAPITQDSDATDPGSRSDPEQDRALRAELASSAEKLRGLSYYEMLGVDEQADTDALGRAYDELAKRTHPDRFSAASSAVRQLAEEVHQLYARAHETLVDPKRRRDYDGERKRGQRQAAEREEGRRALEAEIEFQKGEALMRQRDYQRALNHFGAALSCYPEEGEYHAHYGWCLHLRHPDDVGMAQEAIEHVMRGVKLARDREKPYLFLGRLHKVVGKLAQAEKMFTRAVQIRPDCVEALRELRLINLRRQKGRGLIGRLLRRQG